MANWIKFLGTAGARFVMIKQLRSSAGVWYHLNDLDICVDPGPGTLVKCASSRPRLNPAALNAIILSHKHIDHSTDINVLIEAMTDGGLKRRGSVFAPADALNNDPVILQYVRPFPEKLVTLREGGTYPLSDDLLLETPLLHQHPVETYGLKFRLPGLTIAHVVDSAYFDSLISAYRDAQVLILHVVRYRGESDREKGIMHLNLEDARKMISEIRPRIVVLTHFGMTMLKAKPWEIAASLTEQLQVDVRAASDGMLLDIEKI